MATQIKVTPVDDWRSRPAIQQLFIGNHALLFACASMYFGTGWSLVLFSFPIAPELTVENYYMQFVPQVEAATAFFTYMTVVMLVTSVVMIVAEWRTRLVWVPVVVLTAIILATAVTMIFIFPYNQAMSSGITDPDVLTGTLDRWMSLNRVRVGFWTVQWLSLMTYFAIRAWHGRRAR